jgi:hypothetical protein
VNNHLKEEECWGGGVAGVVESLPSKPEALSSNPRTVKQTNKQQTRRGIYILMKGCLRMKLTRIITVSVFHDCDKYLKKINLKEEFNFVSVSWWLGSKERERK